MKSHLLMLYCFLFGFFCAAFYFSGSPQRIDPKAYMPMDRKPRGFFQSRHRRISHLAHEKSKLKQLGTTVAMYYSGGLDAHFPDNPQEFDIDISLMHPSHLRGTYSAVAQSWQIPDNWLAFNHSQSPYIFVPNSQEKYTGASDQVLFIVRNGYQAYPEHFSAVFEDGHVESLNQKRAIKLWKKAGVWNGNDY